jgi:uncharacterized membrane protein
LINLYSVFKFLHVVAVIVWLGGLFTTSIVTARVAREGNQSALASLMRQSGFIGRSVLGPAAGLSLIAGVVMVIDGGIGFATLWIAWGVGALIVSMGLGASVIRRSGEQLGRLLASENRDEEAVMSLQRRLQTLSVVIMLILLSAVWMMVTKPTL